MINTSVCDREIRLSVIEMDPYRKALYLVSKELSKDDVEAILFLNGEKFGAAQTEGIKKPIEFFTLLINHGYINETKNGFLIELLHTIDRVHREPDLLCVTCRPNYEGFAIWLGHPIRVVQTQEHTYWAMRASGLDI